MAPDVSSDKRSHVGKKFPGGVDKGKWNSSEDPEERVEFPGSTSFFQGGSPGWIVVAETASSENDAVKRGWVGQGRVNRIGERHLPKIFFDE